MRPIVLASALLAALAISATAHATPVTTTYFHFHDTGGRSISFSLDSSQIEGFEPGAVVQYGTLFNGTPALVQFINPTWCLSNCLNGAPFDFSFQTSALDPSGFLGPQLYTGDESDPTFILGTYDLGVDYFGSGADASLTISSTPEPSSLLLLGTGVLGCVGALRRRFVKA